MTKLVITTSVALTETQKKSIEDKLKKKYGEFNADYQIETALIGGIKIFDGDKVYDGTVKNQLKNIRDKICNATK